VELFVFGRIVGTTICIWLNTLNPYSVQPYCESCTKSINIKDTWQFSGYIKIPALQYPEVRSFLAHNIFKRYFAISNKFIWRNRSVVEDSEVDVFSTVHLCTHLLIPYWWQRFLLRLCPCNLNFVDVDSNIWVEHFQHIDNLQPRQTLNQCTMTNLILPNWLFQIVTYEP